MSDIIYNNILSNIEQAFTINHSLDIGKINISKYGGKILLKIHKPHIPNPWNKYERIITGSTYTIDLEKLEPTATSPLQDKLLVSEIELIKQLKQSEYFQSNFSKNEDQLFYDSLIGEIIDLFNENHKLEIRNINISKYGDTMLLRSYQNGESDGINRSVYTINLDRMSPTQNSPKKDELTENEIRLINQLKRTQYYNSKNNRKNMMCE